MAGSVDHCIRREDALIYPDYKGPPVYRGTRSLENMGDMAEAVDEMMFVIGVLSNGYNSDEFKEAIEKYYRCVRREEPWPEFWKPE